MTREPAAAFATAPAGFTRTGQGLAVSALLHVGVAMALVAYGWGSGTLQLDGEMVVALTWEGPQADAGGVVVAPIAPSAPEASAEAPVSPPVPITDPVAPPEPAPESDALALAEPVPDPVALPEAEPAPATEPEPEPTPDTTAEAEPLPEPVPEPEVAPDQETQPVEQAAAVPPAPARPAAPPRPRAAQAEAPASTPAQPRADTGEARALLSLPPGPGWSMADPDAGGATGAPGDLQAPRLLSRTTPPYPPAARRQGREGVTTVAIDLDDQGIVLDVRVLESSGYLDLDSAALAAVRAWRFSPARRAGVPIAARLDLAVRFDLDGTSPP